MCLNEHEQSFSENPSPAAERTIFWSTANGLELYIHEQLCSSSEELTNEGELAKQPGLTLSLL